MPLLVSHSVSHVFHVSYLPPALWSRNRLLLFIFVSRSIRSKEMKGEKIESSATTAYPPLITCLNFQRFLLFALISWSILYDRECEPFGKLTSCLFPFLAARRVSAPCNLTAERWLVCEALSSRAGKGKKTCDSVCPSLGGKK